MASRALIVVDAQYDHLSGGVLGDAESDAVLASLIEAAKNTDLVVATRKINPDVMTKHYCVKGTKGARIHSAIEKRAKYVTTTDGLSAFEGGTLRPLRSLRDILSDEGIVEVDIGGFYLEGSVAQTAFDANAHGFTTTVLKAATKHAKKMGYTPTWEERLEKAGINVA